MKIENDNTFMSHLQNGINLFLGAGFSVGANGNFEGKNKAMPVGDILRKEILQVFGRDPNSQIPLPHLCQIISKTQRSALNEFFRSRFTVVDYDQSYSNLERLNIKAIFTTNIDDLIYKIFEGSHK